MGPVNNVLNTIDKWSQPTNYETGASQGAFTRHIATRAATVVVGTPLEIVAVAQNALAAPFQAAGAVVQLAAKTLSVITGAKFLKQLEANLPSAKDFFKTIARVIAYAIGAFASATLGVLSPSANFKFQCWLGVSDNRREHAAKAALQAQEAGKQVAIAEAAKKAALEEAAKKEQEAIAQALAAEKEAEAKRLAAEEAERQALAALEVVHTAANSIEEQAQKEEDDKVIEQIRDLIANAEAAAEAEANANKEAANNNAENANKAHSIFHDLEGVKNDGTIEVEVENNRGYAALAWDGLTFVPKKIYEYATGFFGSRSTAPSQSV